MCFCQNYLIYDNFIDFHLTAEIVKFLTEFLDLIFFTAEVAEFFAKNAKFLTGLQGLSLLIIFVQSLTLSVAYIGN